MILKKINKIDPPVEGDYKITYHFALFPKRIDGFKIWMERYKKVYEWKVRDRVINLSGRIYDVGCCGSWDLIAEQRF